MFEVAEMEIEAKPVLAKKRLTVEEYFRLEEISEERHEFYKGEIYTMGKTTKNHNEITDNVKTAIKQLFVPKGCKAYSENIQLEVIKGIYYPYPDIILTCDKRDAADEYIVRYPTLLVEVLSKSTADKDHGFKWLRYRRMPSLQFYLMISQNEHFVELYTRKGNSLEWDYAVFEKEEDVVQFKGLDFSLQLKTIYENVKLVSVAAEEEE